VRVPVACSLVAAMLVCGCDNKSASSSAGSSRASGSASGGSARASGSATDGSAAPRPPAPPSGVTPLATTSGKALATWAASAPKSKRLRPAEVDAAARAELEALAPRLTSRPSPKLRWARVLTNDAVAFSYGSRDNNEASRTDVGYAVAVPANSGYAVYAHADDRLDKDDDTNVATFGKDRDIDGDGHLDVLGLFRHGKSGGGPTIWGAVILMGSRGGVFAVDVYLHDGEYEDPDDSFDKISKPVVLCWKPVLGHDTLFVVRREVDTYKKGKPAEYSYYAVRAGDDGMVGYVDLFAPIMATGTDAVITRKWKAAGGKTAPMFVRPSNLEAESDVDEPIECPEGPLVVPTPKGLALLGDPVTAKPDVDVLSFDARTNSKDAR